MSLSILALLLLAAASSASSADADPRWTVLGCFASSDDYQLFGNLVKEADCMTRSYCHRECQTRSYKYFGLKVGKRCYCDNYLRASIRAPDNRCAWNCGGNYLEKCGSDNGMLVMEIVQHPGPASPTPGVGSPVGCFMSDDASVALRHSALEASCMTQSFCRDECVQRSFKYFGLRKGNRCYCGNSLNGASAVSDDSCNWRCGGDHRERCGSASAMLVSGVADLSAGGSKSSAQSAATTTVAPATTVPTTGGFQMLKLIRCNQGSVLDGATCDRAYDGNTNRDFGQGSCSQTQSNSQSGYTSSWWTARFARPAHVMEVRIYNRADCCADKLNNFFITVDRTRCVHHKSSAPFSVRTFQCEANGTLIAIDTILSPLTLCEVQVFGEYL